MEIGHSVCGEGQYLLLGHLIQLEQRDVLLGTQDLDESKLEEI